MSVSERARSGRGADHPGNAAQDVESAFPLRSFRAAESEVVLTDEELAALTPPGAPRPMPLDVADALAEPVRRAVLLSALRSLAARGLVASGERGGTVVAAEPLAGLLAVRSAPRAIARFELDVGAAAAAGSPRGEGAGAVSTATGAVDAEVVLCHLGADGTAVVETRSAAGMHRLLRRDVPRVAASMVVAVAQAEVSGAGAGVSLDTTTGAAGAGADASRVEGAAGAGADASRVEGAAGADGGARAGSEPRRSLDDPEVAAALTDVAAVGRLVVRHRDGRQGALSLVASRNALWLVAGEEGAAPVAQRIGRRDAARVVAAALTG